MPDMPMLCCVGKTVCKNGNEMGEEGAQIEPLVLSLSKHVHRLLRYAVDMLRQAQH